MSCGRLIDQLRRKAAPVAVLLANRQEEEKKVMLIAGLSRDLVERGLDAVALGPRRRPRWSAAAAAVGPTWPKPAASTPTSCPTPFSAPGGHRKNVGAVAAAPDGYLPPSGA